MQLHRRHDNIETGKAYRISKMYMRIATH